MYGQHYKKGRYFLLLDATVGLLESCNHPYLLYSLGLWTF